jgi:hypothetical protein
MESIYKSYQNAKLIRLGLERQRFKLKVRGSARNGVEKLA